MLIRHIGIEVAARNVATSVLFFVAVVRAFAGPDAEALERLGRTLEAMPEFAAEASWQVLLPMAEDPVVYSLVMESKATPTDTLSPCQYLIQWSVPTATGSSSGFSAYFDGNHFRLRDRRLQEYHAQWDGEPFAPGGVTSKGVQLQAQFASLLPQVMGRRFVEMASDSTYSYTVSQRPGRIEVKGVQTVAGYDCLEFTYEFDLVDLRPLAISLENNPGLISEQSVAVRYTYPAGLEAADVDMDRLVAGWPEAFSQYRESSFTLETLPGRYLPAFSAERIDGRRYNHNATDNLPEPTIFVVLDAAVASTPQVISDVRAALAEIPDCVDVVWAFVSNHADEIMRLTGTPADHETILVGARSLARDCGVADTPAMIFCSPRARVTDVVVGFNNQLRPLVIQKATAVRYFSDPEADIEKD